MEICVLLWTWIHLWIQTWLHAFTSVCMSPHLSDPVRSLINTEVQQMVSWWKWTLNHLIIEIRLALASIKRSDSVSCPEIFTDWTYMVSTENSRTNEVCLMWTCSPQFKWRSEPSWPWSGFLINPTFILSFISRWGNSICLPSCSKSCIISSFLPRYCAQIGFNHQCSCFNDIGVMFVWHWQTSINGSTVRPDLYLLLSHSLFFCHLFFRFPLLSSLHSDILSSVNKCAAGFTWNNVLMSWWCIWL